jgi:L-alanine-DL-glutamate epimerase-like enolase superfamily enzyme
LHTDDGTTGLGEAFYGAGSVEAYVHDSVAPALLALDDVTPERAARVLAPYAGFQGGGAELRGNGAVDVALWDLLGKRTSQPLVRLLGGPVRDTMSIYNTCAGSRYVSESSRQHSDNWGLTSAVSNKYEDLDAFLTRPASLARELLSEGITAMKIWPFDRAAEATLGNKITAAQLAEGVGIVEAIRSEVGFDMEILIELHGLWSRGSAAAICAALTPVRPYWVEDPLRPDAATALAALSREVDVQIATGETCVGRRGFLPLLTQSALHIATVDIGWTGGLTEARKIAALADAYSVPVAPHDCTGPVSLAASVHLVYSCPNGLVQETARAFLRTWYGELADGLPEIIDGTVRCPSTPGHGVTLRPELLADGASTVRRSQR